MNTWGLPSMLRPMYHELAAGISDVFATSATCAVHSDSEAALASIVAIRFARRCAMQSEIHSTCCSIETGMLLSTDGLPGPVTVKRFGKSATIKPR